MLIGIKFNCNTALLFKTVQFKVRIHLGFVLHISLHVESSYTFKAKIY